MFTQFRVNARIETALPRKPAKHNACEQTYQIILIGGSKANKARYQPLSAVERLSRHAPSSIRDAYLAPAGCSAKGIGAKSSLRHKKIARTRVPFQVCPRRPPTGLTALDAFCL
jgi:hypothetical protein